MCKKCGCKNHHHHQKKQSMNDKIMAVTGKGHLKKGSEGTKKASNTQGIMLFKTAREKKIRL